MLCAIVVIARQIASQGAAQRRSWRYLKSIESASIRAAVLRKKQQ
jgi:hypothetical protein